MKPLKCENCFAIALVLLLGSIVWAEPPDEKDKTVTIPLDQIWANRMPGTRDIDELDVQPSLVLDIRRAIGFSRKDKDAKPAFAVLGTGLDALRGAHAVFVDKKKPRDDFPAGSEVSVVFFAHETRPYVHLHKIERQGETVDVYYRFVYHEDEEMNMYVALIPVGKLPSGRYDVNVVRSKKYERRRSPLPSDEVARRVVCGSFSFTVSGQGE